MDKKELNSILMDSFEVAELWFANGNHYADMTLKQRRETLKNYHGKDLYEKLAGMNLGATSSASRIMLLSLSGRTIGKVG
tara:strand:+ start:2912 stop:3151 length:240 start_codon:yes stop_codon:yes gene_type:complete